MLFLRVSFWTCFLINLTALYIWFVSLTDFRDNIYSRKIPFMPGSWNQLESYISSKRWTLHEIKARWSLDDCQPLAFKNDNYIMCVLFI